MSRRMIKQSRLRQLHFLRSLGFHHIQFSYPFIVLFEDNRNLCIVDLTYKDQDASKDIERFSFENDIKSFIIHDYKLWVAFETSHLIIIDVEKKLQLKIEINNNASYKISRFVSEEKNLLLVSESGERLASPFSTDDLNSKFDKGLTELSVTLKRCVKSYKNAINEAEYNYSVGFNFSINEQKIGIKCPVTGVLDILYTNNDVEFIVPWSEMAVVGNKLKMSVLNFEEYNIDYEFENFGLHCYPLGAYDSEFYFLLWDIEEVHICCAVSLESDDHPNIENLAVITPTFTQESLKLKLKELIEQAIQTVKPEIDLMPQLHTLFNGISDYPFLLDMATKLCKWNLSYKLLLFQIQKKVFAIEDNSSLNKLFADTVIKIELLEYIYFRGINYYDINLFDLNFTDLCLTFISKGDLDLASICWLKYLALKPAISEDDISKMLYVLPLNIKMGGLIVWLRNFIPPLLQENPYNVDLFVKWTTDRVFLLEQSTNWPKIGLKFIEEIIIVLEGSLKTISLRPISIDDLDILKDHLTYIMELKLKHKINMLLSELNSQSPSEVALIMMRRCYTEDLEDFLQSTLPFYAARYQFELDDTLRFFIESEAASSRGCVDGNRLQILLNAFRSPSNRLECLLQVLKVLEVPWNETVVNIATEAAATANTDFTATEADRRVAKEIYLELNSGSRIKVILKKYNFPLSFTNYILVIHKIVNAPSVDVNDLKVVTTVINTYAYYAHVLYIDKCLQDCNTSVALEYYNSLPNNNRKVLVQAVINKYEQIINRKIKDSSTEMNYLDFLHGTKSVDEKFISKLEHLYHLKNSYDITLTLNNFCTEKVRNETVRTWEQQGGISSSGRGRCLHQLLGKSLSRDSNLLDLLHEMSASHEVRTFVERFILSNAKESLDFSVLSDFKDGNNSQILLGACEVLSEIVLNCDEKHIHYVMERLAILKSLINSNITMANLSVAWKFQHLYLSMSSVPALNDLIDFYIHTAKNKEFDIVHNVSNKSDFLPVRIIGYIMTNATGNRKLSDDFLETRTRICKKLLAKVIAAKDLDQLLLTSLLLTVCEGETTDNTWILDILRGKSDTISSDALQYLSSPIIHHTFELTGLIPNTNTYPPQYVLKNKFNIDLAEIALPENTEETWDVKILLFYILKQFSNTSFERLTDICETLNVSLDHGLSLLLISILSNWNLKYRIISDNLRCRQLLVDNDENELLSKCLIIWDSIKIKDFIKDILSDFWKNGEVTLHGCVVSLNSYYYEIYLCIYHLMFGSSTESQKSKEYFLLNFLKDYKRRSTPRQYEFELFSVKGVFPDLGHYRLPFHLFMRDDMWSNLKSEITLETYEYWLPVFPLLSLDSHLQTAKDMICSNAVKQTMTSRKRQDSNELDPKEREPWRLISREEPLLRAAHKCVKHIANMEWAGACLFYVLQGCARGIDQVSAAQLCFQFSQRWAAVQPGNRAVQQMERLHSSLSTRHALYKIDWACEELIRLSSEPVQLIHALYLHPKFVNKISRYDVNRAANEIAEKNNINISSIRIQILENILNKTKKDNCSRFGLTNTDLITAKYILKATCPKMGAIYLSRIAFDEESDYDKCKKLGALQCLMSVVEQETSVKVTNLEREVLWNSLMDLLIIVNLEKIDMPYIVATIMQDKMLAIKQLIPNVIGNVEGLKVAAKIAYIYGNSKIIQELIPHLLQATLYEEMIPLLLHLLSPPDNNICTAWRAIILDPFQRADYPITERQKSNCLTALNLLPVCPAINDEDLVEIWKNCIRCKQPGLGCLVLPYMTVQKRQTLSELHKIDKRNLIISLKNLQSDTYLISGAMYVLENMSRKICM